MSSHVCILYMCQQLRVYVWNEVNYKFIHNFSSKFTCELITTLLAIQTMVHELAGRQTRLSTGEVANCANKMKRASSPYLLFVVAIPF